MSVEQVKTYLKELGSDAPVIETSEPSGTVAQAARAIGTQERRIAKTLAFLMAQGPALIVVAGDAKIDNRKYKTAFAQKATMIPSLQTEDVIGHAPGGVCPFAVKPGVRIYLDESLKRFSSVYPAAGSANSHVHLTIAQLEELTRYDGWVDVTRLPDQDVTGQMES